MGPDASRKMAQKTTLTNADIKKTAPKFSAKMPFALRIAALIGICSRSHSAAPIRRLPVDRRKAAESNQDTGK